LTKYLRAFILETYTAPGEAYKKNRRWTTGWITPRGDPAFCFFEGIMDITTAAVFEHEMAKEADFRYGFESLIRNTAILDRMLVSAETDYVIGGAVTSMAGSLAIRIGAMWGNGRSLDLPVYSDGVSSSITLSAPLASIRFDIVQVRAVFEEFDAQRRAFFNPETGAGEYFTVPTKMRLKTEYQVKQGTEGYHIAPDADVGWIKLAELFLEPGITGLLDDNIRNITAIHQSEENSAWTNQKSRTFQLGSQLQLKEILAKEHTVTGEHRPKVIDAGNIDFGIDANQVNSKAIPLGEEYQVGTGGLTAGNSLFSALLSIASVIAAIIQSAEDTVHEAPNDGTLYGRKNKLWAPVSEAGGSAGIAIETPKVYSKKTLMLTNTRIVDRRKRGWDIGLPYLSSSSRVYHFDTDLRDQYQETLLNISHAGDAPGLVNKDDIAEGIHLNPAVLDTPPHEMIGRSLFGRFKVAECIGTAETCTVEAWIRRFGDNTNQFFKFGSGMESITIQTGAVSNPEYGAAESDGIVYGEAEPGMSYSVAESDGISWGAAESDGIAYGGATAEIPYSVAGDDGETDCVVHEWLNGRETASLGSAGIDIPDKTWTHLAAVQTHTGISLFVKDKRIDFVRRSRSAHPMSFEFNRGKTLFNIDELFFDASAEVDFAAFCENTDERIPYAALDYKEKWFVLEAQDTAKVKTNLFETAQFRAAVQAVIDAQG
jgi:hypothetical protein